jgi:transposase
MCDARKERGQAIAERCKIVTESDRWLVPSQSSGEWYAVRQENGEWKCNCPDHETRGTKCKHAWAVEISMTRVERNADGTTTVSTVTVKAERKTYAQPDWSAYHAHQVNERRHFLDLLGELCDGITMPEAKDRNKGGRPTIPVRDAIFSAVMKVYSLTSARRFSGELAEAHEAGYIGQCPHFNSVLNVFDREETTPILRKMIETSALPLRSVESQFAIDSTGFASTRYTSWCDHKHGGIIRKKATWVKAHFIVGTKTHTVCAVEIEGPTASDTKQLPALYRTAKANMDVRELSADGAYCGNPNFNVVEATGAKFFPSFSTTATGEVGGSFAKAFHYFQFQKEEYLQHYHRRSNVESVVSMVKRKFGDSVKAKNELAQKNEVYAKLVCHNVCVLIAEMYALGINPILSGPSCTQTDSPAQILPFRVG